MNRALERISPKPIVAGFIEIFDEFRNGCDEKSDTISPQVVLMKFVHRRKKI